MAAVVVVLSVLVILLAFALIAGGRAFWQLVGKHVAVHRELAGVYEQQLRVTTARNAALERTVDELRTGQELTAPALRDAQVAGQLQEITRTDLAFGESPAPVRMPRLIDELQAELDAIADEADRAEYRATIEQLLLEDPARDQRAIIQHLFAS